MDSSDEDERVKSDTEEDDDEMPVIFPVHRRKSSVNSKFSHIEKLMFAPVNDFHDERLPPWMYYMSEKFIPPKTLRKRWNLMEKNVFQCQDEMNEYEMVKFGLGLVLVFVRFILMMIVFIFFAASMILTTLDLNLDDPLPEAVLKRHRTIKYVSYQAAVLILGVIVKVKGKPCDLSESTIQVGAPHSTWLDIFVVSFANNGQLTSEIGKAEVAGNLPLFNQLFSAMQVILVDRFNKTSRTNVAKKLRERAYDRRFQRKVFLFPEGTCANRTALLRFQTGAFKTKLPVQPVILKWGSNEIPWTNGSKNRFLLFLRIMAEPFHSVQVEFLDVYYPNNEETQRPVFYANNVRDVCSRKLGIPVCEASILDRKLAKIAAKSGVRPGKVLDFYVEEMYEVARGPGIVLNDQDFDEQVLYDNFTKILENMLTAYVNICDKVSGKMNAEKLDWIKTVRYRYMILQNLPREERIATEKVIDKLEYDEIMKNSPDDFLTFRRLMQAFCFLKYK